LLEIFQIALKLFHYSSTKNFAIPLHTCGYSSNVEYPDIERGSKNILFQHSKLLQQQKCITIFQLCIFTLRLCKNPRSKMRRYAKSSVEGHPMHGSGMHNTPLETQPVNSFNQVPYYWKRARASGDNVAQLSLSRRVLYLHRDPPAHAHSVAEIVFRVRACRRHYRVARHAQ